MKTQREVEDEIDSIESRPLSRAERDALQRPLLVELSAIRERMREHSRIQRDLARELIHK